MQDRRSFLKMIGAGGVSLALGESLMNCSRNSGAATPNVVFILADDLGYKELGCYGQEKIRTPNLDKLAQQGMRFTQHYSGSPVCAPSRCTLLTGKHTGHAFIRDNDEYAPPGVDVWQHPEVEGQRPIPPNTFTLGSLFQQAGYTTACIGKWGLGGPGTEGEPNRQGFDHFYGYLCQRQAHNYYPDHLWRDGTKETLENTFFSAHQKLPDASDPNDPNSYLPYQGKQYSFDLMLEDAVHFVQTNRSRPFFLYFAPTIPHLALQVPEDSVQEYEGAFPDQPYKGDKGYLPNRTPRATYAGMITRLDRGVGRILELLRSLNLEENTLVIFTSDNGPTYTGGADTTFFESAGKLHGLKGQVYEGGIRVPMIACWPGSIPAGSVSSHPSAFWDYMATFADLLDVAPPERGDGVSMLPSLRGDAKDQQEHEYLYWEHIKRLQAVRAGQWKAVRLNPTSPMELYDLEADENETTDIASAHPDIIEKMKGIMETAHTASEFFPLVTERK